MLSDSEELKCFNRGEQKTTGVVQPRGRAGQRNYEESTRFFFSQQEGGGGDTKRDGKRRVGSPRSHCGWLWEVSTQRDEGRSLRKGAGRKASSNLIGDLFCLSSSTLQVFLFSLHNQNFLGPQADACFGATPVPNVGKSSALLMSGAWNKQNKKFEPLFCQI